MSKELKCILRNELVSASPEELVRQACLLKMLDLGYPSSLIVVEKSLSQLVPKMSDIDLPKRRMDIVCFSNNNGITPLLLIECKAKKITKSSINQALGYNYYLKAPFIACASPSNFFIVSPFLPPIPKLCDLLPYKTLLELIRR